MKILPTAFDGQPIRRVYDQDTETWWFSVVDVVQVLTQQPDDLTARKYWNQLKRRLNQEGSQLVTDCHQLKMPAADGKQRLTDVAHAESLLRLVQSIPSPKAEPIKLWLAKVGYERMQEMADPALSLDRARHTWQQHGRSDKWIQQRMTGQETRNKLTDYWRDHAIKDGKEFAILTNIIHQEWSGVSVKEHKQTKGLSSHNLRDHVTEAELIFLPRWQSCPPAKLPNIQTPRVWQKTPRPHKPVAALQNKRANNWRARLANRSCQVRTTWHPRSCPGPSGRRVR